MKLNTKTRAGSLAANHDKTVRQPMNVSTLIRPFLRVAPPHGAMEFHQSRHFGRLAPAIMLLLVLGIGLQSEAAIIYVTSTAQKVSSTGGCSLQEAIYSSNWRNNMADATGAGTIITTQCEPGNGK